MSKELSTYDPKLKFDLGDDIGKPQQACALCGNIVVWHADENCWQHHLPGVTCAFADKRVRLIMPYAAGTGYANQLLDLCAPTNMLYPVAKPFLKPVFNAAAIEFVQEEFKKAIKSALDATADAVKKEAERDYYNIEQPTPQRPRRARTNTSSSVSKSSNTPKKE